RRGVPRFPVAHDLIHVCREVRIEYGPAAGFLLVSFRERDALGDCSPLWSGGADDRQRLCISLDHDFRTGLYTFQDSGEVAYRVGFTHTQNSRLHTCHHSVSPPPDASPTPRESPLVSWSPAVTPGAVRLAFGASSEAVAVRRFCISSLADWISWISTMLYRRSMESVRWPEIRIRTTWGTPSRRMFRTAVRRRSWNFSSGTPAAAHAFLQVNRN